MAHILIVEARFYDHLNDMLLAGAIPAAVLALLTQGLFELVERWVVAGRQR